MNIRRINTCSDFLGSSFLLQLKRIDLIMRRP